MLIPIPYFITRLRINSINYYIIDHKSIRRDLFIKMSYVRKLYRISNFTRSKLEMSYLINTNLGYQAGTTPDWVRHDNNDIFSKSFRD